MNASVDDDRWLRFSVCNVEIAARVHQLLSLTTDDGKHRLSSMRVWLRAALVWLRAALVWLRVALVCCRRFAADEFAFCRQKALLLVCARLFRRRLHCSWFTLVVLLCVRSLAGNDNRREATSKGARCRKRALADESRLFTPAVGLRARSLAC